MSRWFPETVHLLVGGAKSQPAGLAATGTDVEPAVDRSADRVARARAARLEQQLAAFAARLDALAPEPGTRLCCWLGSDVARHLIVPWQQGLTGDSQRELLARHCFREVFGASAADWTVRLGRSAYGRPVLASAVEAALLARLEALAHDRKLRLAVVRPLLMEAHNRALPDLRESRDAWFVLIEGPWLTLLLLQDGSPRAFKLVTATDADLGRILEREWRSLGVDGPRCPVVLARYGADHAVSAATLAHELSDYGWALRVAEPFVDDGPQSAPIALVPVARVLPTVKAAA